MKPLCTLLFLLFVSLCCYSRKVELSSDYLLNWELTSNLIKFKLDIISQNDDLQWVGFWLHPVGSSCNKLMNSDAIIMTWDSGKPTVNDYSNGKDGVILDTELGGVDNLLSPVITQNSGKITITFSRKLDTGDQFDVPITIGPMKVTWALGKDDNFENHWFDSKDREFKFVDFFVDDNTDVSTSLAVCDNVLANAWVPDGYCASVWTSGLRSPRGIITASNGDILVVEASLAQVTVIWNFNGTLRKTRLAAAQGLNHGITIFGPYLYASSTTTVYRWRYTAGQRVDLGTPQIIVKNIPTGGHSTRTVKFDNAGLLYVTCGSGSNVDSSSIRSRIRRYDLTTIPTGGYDWTGGILFADGLRNEVAINFDSQGRLWGAENGFDNLNRPDLGGDIHNNNPSEEINLLDVAGKFYGYPYCWSEYNLPVFGKGAGTQWAHPNFMNDGVHTDAWCQSTNNVIPPRYNLPAHTAPLDILFNNGNDFPIFPSGGTFVTLHGSWNRQSTSGYSVVYITFDGGLPVSHTDVLRNNGTSASWPNGVRPVALTFNTCGQGQQCLYVTDDGAGQIIEISYNQSR